MKKSKLWDEKWPYSNMAVPMRGNFLFKIPNYVQIISWGSSVHGPLKSPDFCGVDVVLFNLHCCCILCDAPRKDWSRVFLWWMPELGFCHCSYDSPFFCLGVEEKYSDYSKSFQRGGKKRQTGKVNRSFVSSTFLGEWSWFHLLSSYSLVFRKTGITTNVFSTSGNIFTSASKQNLIVHFFIIPAFHVFSSSHQKVCDLTVFPLTRD